MGKGNVAPAPVISAAAAENDTMAVATAVITVLEKFTSTP
jgi:hypothetical protein